MTNQMTPDELTRRLHDVIDTAISDSLTVEIDRAVGRAEIEACEADRREAATVRDEVTAALRRLADVIEYAEKERARIRRVPAASMYAQGEYDALTEIARIARGETTNQTPAAPTPEEVAQALGAWRGALNGHASVAGAMEAALMTLMTARGMWQDTVRGETNERETS